MGESAGLGWTRSRRAVIWVGHLCLLGLLMTASVEAYRIHAGAAARNVEIYREYLRQDQLVNELRRVMWQTSTCARDFFINTRPDRATTFRAQLDALRSRSAGVLTQLAADHAPPAATELKRRFDDFLATVYPIAESRMVVGPDEVYDFVQAEIAPRRSATGLAISDLAQARQQAFQSAQVEFESSRRSAASLLAMMLMTCVALGVAVSTLTLRHSTALERENCRRFAEVCEARRKLGDLSGLLLEVQEEERKHLARELHDEVGQTLTALRIEISRALERPDAPGMRDDMRRARDLANRAVSTTRDLSSLLRPSILDDLGLEAALQWQLEQFSQRSGIAASFTGNGLESDLPDALKTCAYRVVQEALHNCEKHSGASRVNVRLNDAEDSLSIGVRDDGIGFDPAVVKSGYGILGMSERATRLGGTFTLDSAPGCGVSIEVLVPKLETPAAVRSHAPNHCTAG